MINFASQNLIMDPPFTKLDILTCRNLLIYLAPELQKKLFPLFHYSLNPGGILFLGSAESIGGFTDLFASDHSKSRIFLRQHSGTRGGAIEFPSAFVGAPLHESKRIRPPVINPDSLQTLAEQWLLQHHAPAAVLVNNQGDILFVSGRTGRYLEPASGKANWNVFAMTREVLRYELSRTFQKARSHHEPVTSRRIELDSDKSTSFVSLTVQILNAPRALSGLAMIVFTEAGHALKEKGESPKKTSAKGHALELEQELLHAREEIQSTREEMQTSQEELKSMNEELQSANEELQSTNEELTTSKEEMQSLNEELQTVNAELQQKLDELSAASNDMRNLLNSTEIATIFLDNALCVRRFTAQATAIIKLIPGDIGRPVTDLVSNLLYSGLAEDAREELRTLAPIEKTLETHDGRWFAMRLMPYRTMDNRIDGVVITFTDMTAVKKLEAKLRAKVDSSERKQAK